MPANCCVPYCDTGHVKNGNVLRRAMFKAPKDDHQREMWARMIPKKGTLSSTDKVCSVHFEEHDINKASKFIIDGKEVFLPMLNWRLKKNAVPHIFPGCPDNLKKSSPRQRPKNRSKPVVKSRKQPDDPIIKKPSVTQAAEISGSNSNINLCHDNTISLLLPFQYPPLTSTYFNKKKISSEEENFVVVNDELPSESTNNSSSAKSIDLSDADQEEIILNYLSVEMNPTKDYSCSASQINTNTSVVHNAHQPLVGKEDHISSHSVELSNNLSQERSNNIHVNIRNVRLPSLAWAWVEVEIPNRPPTTNMICAENCYIGGKIHIRRSVEIDLLTGVACYSLFGAFLGVDTLNTTFSTESDLSELLRFYGQTKLCPGLSVSQFAERKIPSSFLGYQDGEVLRSSKCSGIEPKSNPCNNCLLLLSRKKS